MFRFLSRRAPNVDVTKRGIVHPTQTKNAPSSFAGVLVNEASKQKDFIERLSKSIPPTMPNDNLWLLREETPGTIYNQKHTKLVQMDYTTGAILFQTWNPEIVNKAKEMIGSSQIKYLGEEQVRKIEEITGKAADVNIKSIQSYIG